MVHEGELHFAQVKKRTPTMMVLPVRDELRAILDATPTVGIATWMVDGNGRSFTARSFSRWFIKRCIEAGLVDRSAHGLRKSAMRRMAEAGWTTHRIAAWSGHDSLREVERYTKAADQARLARDALGTDEERKAVANLDAEAGKPGEGGR
jgi:integrase